MLDDLIGNQLLVALAAARKPGINAITEFVRESNRIEGIHREPTVDEVAATCSFINAPKMTLARLCVLKAYRSLAKRHHPDHGGSTDAMADLNRARDEALATLESEMA